MAANIDPIFTLTPNVKTVTLPTANAVLRSDGVSAATSNDNMYVCFTAGANGSFLDRIRVNPVGAAAAVSTVATSVRIYISSVNSAPSATTAANTFLLCEIPIPLLTSLVALSTGVTPYFEIPIGIPIPAGKYVLCSQHLAQGTNCFLNVTGIGGDY
jgi:hypothetical protein